jgi:hypothetical protein
VNSRGRNWLVWLGLLALFVVEFLLFDRFGSHRVTGIYPRWNDQIQYLSEAYLGYEDSRAHGLGLALWHTLTNPSAQGTLHDFGAVIAFTIAGASRSTALALNMLALIAWQFALFSAVRTVSRRSDVAWLAMLLPVVLRGPWLIFPGSANDFRLDHFALCAFGATSAVALLTDGFRHRGWSAAFGVCVAITMLTRFITGTYFVVIFAAFVLTCIGGDRRLRRLVNILLAAGIVVALAGPIFWLNREWVWNYYYIGHYVGPESAIRNQNFGLWKSTQFVWGRLGVLQLGWFFGAFVGAVAVGLGATRRRSSGRIQDYPVEREGSDNPGPLGERPLPRNESGPVRGAERSPRPTFLFVGALFLLAPALVLTLHPQKSEVVLSVLAPGLVLLVTGGWVAVCADRVKSLRGVTTAATLAAVGFFAYAQMTPGEDPTIVAELRQINPVADYVVAHSRAAKLERPKVAIDHITDALDAQVLRVVCYERHHVWIDFDMQLPTGIAEPDAGLVRERIAASDFVFLLTDDRLYNGFPFDRKLLAMRPELRAWCDAHLKPVLRLTFLSHPITLYQRPSIP